MQYVSGCLPVYHGAENGIRAYIDVYAKHRRKISREACLLRTARFLHSILS
jgi:hypothetical protein